MNRVRSDERVLAMLDRQEAIDGIEVLEAAASRDRRKAIAWWGCLACALALGFVSTAWILVAGYPGWALWHLTLNARLRRGQLEELTETVGE